MDPADREGKGQSACLIETVERLKRHTGHYPERVLADQIYRTLDALLPWSPSLPANCRKPDKNEVK